MKLFQNLFLLLTICVSQVLAGQNVDPRSEAQLQKHEEEKVLGSNSENESSITELIARYITLRKEQNADQLATLFVEDADQLVSSGEWRLGRSAMISGMVRSTSRNPGNRSIEVERVRFISNEVAVADARYTIKGSSGAPDRKMWSTFIAVVDDDAWKISAIRNMLPARRRSN